jgi:hypothetical protein
MGKSSRMSAARRRAEMLLNQNQTRQEGFRQEQRRAQQAMTEKTERLRALRLAKEEADKETAASAPTSASGPRKVGRSEQT